MKFLGLALMMSLITLGANAGTGTTAELKDYWKPGYSILSKGLLNEGIPNKGMRTRLGTVYTKIFNVCRDGNTLHTVRDVKMCSEWGYKPERCDDGDSSKDCFDRDERVCVAYENVPGKSVIKGTKQVCAKKSDKEARQWRRDNMHNDRKFKTDFPNCSVFKTVSANVPSSFDFLIVKKGSDSRPGYRSSLGGVLVDEITWAYPTCN
jgi:hypothetical protein